MNKMKNRGVSHIFQLNPADLIIDKFEIYRIMGYSRNEVPQNIVTDIDELLPLAFSKMEIKCGYQKIASKNYGLKNDGFIVDEIEFHCGKIIRHHLKNTEKAMFFAATLGNDFDKLSKKFNNSGDPYKGYLVDSIGSVMVECAIEWLMTKIDNELQQYDFFATNRFSPGYCSWNVAEQQKLFSKLPKDFLGIELLKSSLMLPIKSVSGMIGIGKHVKKMSYTCNICNQENCIMRKHKFNQEK